LFNYAIYPTLDIKEDQKMIEQKILKDMKVLENQVLITQCSRLKRAWIDKLQQLAKILIGFKK
tara:strand:+ start:967 stop:1155 length:189 start_codon:yes stop_codon:yes gene_type:complete